MAIVSGGEPGEIRDVVVAVNGRIAASTETFALATDPDQELISAMIPPWSLTAGKNEIAFYEVLPDGSLRAL